MLSLRRRGKTFHIDCPNGAARLRGSLGTRNQDAARRLVHRLEIAMSEGPDSSVWSELKQVLPVSTFNRLADAIGVKERQPLTWKDLYASFIVDLQQRVAIGKLSAATLDRYSVTLREFDLFLGEQGIILLADIGKPVVERFKLWRLQRITKRTQSRGGGGLMLDTAILHRIFAVALEGEMITKNPVLIDGRPGENPQKGAQPFNGTELSSLRDNAGEDLLAFLLLRWTGLRGSDVVKLGWREVHFGSKEIERVTQKRSKRVILPIHSELMFLLEAEYQQREPMPDDRVLINPATKRPLTRPRLYQRMLALGRRAGVLNAHPHRFRDTLAVDMLVRGASPYDVAKMLGDTIDTVERHYTPFVKELRERVRTMLENGAGLENIAEQSGTRPQKTSGRVQ